MQPREALDVAELADAMDEHMRRWVHDPDDGGTCGPWCAGDIAAAYNLPPGPEPSVARSRDEWTTLLHRADDERYVETHETGTILNFNDTPTGKVILDALTASRPEADR